MKRWYCPECGSVHTVRPASHQARNGYPKKTIQTALLCKLETGLFCPKTAKRQIQQYWYKNLRCWFSAKSLEVRQEEMIRHIREADHIRVGICLFDRLIDYEGVFPYLPFALSTRGRFF